ncbi:MAG: DNA-3-methyladenine glycosylase [Cyclobacteriaceae bacterium]
MNRIECAFYQSSDVVSLSRKLLGAELHTNINGQHTSGIIVETEAYHESEKACHAYRKRRTKRTEVLFHHGGLAYVYLCYGIHHLFNVTVGPEGEAAAILIRAIEPQTGIDLMLVRRKLSNVSPRVGAGPGVASQALGIEVMHSGEDLNGELVWLEHNENRVKEADIVSSPRIGVDYAEEDAQLLWRFSVINNKWVSK